MKRLKRYIWIAVTLIGILSSVFQTNIAYASTSVTFYPDAHAEVTSGDSNVSRVAAQAAWATIRAGAGTAAVSSTDLGTGTAYTSSLVGFTAGTTTNLYVNLYRSIFTFDTSSLPTGCIINSAQIQIYGNGKTASSVPPTSGFAVAIVASTPASSTAIAAADFTQLGATALSNQIGYASWSTTGYNTFTLTAAGLALIDDAGVTKFGLREMVYDAGGTLPESWGSSKYQRIFGHTAEAAAGYKPKLIINYTQMTAPVMDTTNASSVLNTSAQLNGAVTDIGGAVLDNYGFVWDVVSHSDPGNTAPAASAYANNYLTGTGASVGAVLYFKTGLAASTTYYYRVTAHNANGWGYGDEVSFRTLDAPTCAILAATNITTTTARLNGSVVSWGGELCDARFAYGTTTQAVFTDYDTVTDWVNDTYNNTTNSTPYVDIGSLNAGDTYFYRIQVRNVIGTVMSAEITFGTDTGVDEPTELRAIPLASSVSLSWVKDPSASYTIIRYSTAGYPATYTDGSSAYIGTGNSASISSLTPGMTYYLAAWGMTEGIYSGAPTQVMATTSAYDIPPTTGNTIEVPKTDNSFTQTPDTAKVSRIPIAGGLIDINSTAYGIPLNYLWYFLWVLATVGLGVIVYNKSGKYNLVISLAAMGLSFGLGVVVGLIMLWILLVMCLIGAGFSMFGFNRS